MRKSGISFLVSYSVFKKKKKQEKNTTSTKASLTPSAGKSQTWVLPPKLLSHSLFEGKQNMREIGEDKLWFVMLERYWSNLLK